MYSVFMESFFMRHAFRQLIPTLRPLGITSTIWDGIANGTNG